MQTTVEIIDTINRKINITIDSEKIDTAVDKKINSLKNSVHIDGFRKGKVPLSVIRKRYAHAVRADIINELIQSTYSEALQAENIIPASQPTINTEDKAFLSGDFTYSATFEVYPEIKITDLSKIKIEIPETKINDADVDSTIKKLQEQNHIFVDSKAAAKNGSQVTINFVGSIDGVEFEGGKADNILVTIGKGNMIDGFEDGLIGLKANEDTTLNLTFPENYQAKDLAGKKAQFVVKVLKVANPKLPKLDTEFFKKFNTKDEESFRAQIKKNLNAENKHAKNKFIKNQVMDALVQAHSKIELPKAVIQREIDTMVGTLKNQMQGGQNTQNLDKLFSDTTAMRPEAERRVRLGLVIAEIVDANKITVDEAKLKQFIEDESTSYDEPQKFIDHYLNNKENLQSIEPVVLELQVIDHIIANCKTKEVALNFNQLIKKIENIT